MRECDYHSEELSTHVTVRGTSFYTIISVNGVDVYFYRFSGIPAVCAEGGQRAGGG